MEESESEPQMQRGRRSPKCHVQKSKFGARSARKPRWSSESKQTEPARCSAGKIPIDTGIDKQEHSGGGGGGWSGGTVWHLESITSEGEGQQEMRLAPGVRHSWR